MLSLFGPGGFVPITFPHMLATIANRPFYKNSSGLTKEGRFRWPKRRSLNVKLNVLDFDNVVFGNEERSFWQSETQFCVQLKVPDCHLHVYLTFSVIPYKRLQQYFRIFNNFRCFHVSRDSKVTILN